MKPDELTGSDESGVGVVIDGVWYAITDAEPELEAELLEVCKKYHAAKKFTDQK